MNDQTSLQSLLMQVQAGSEEAAQQLVEQYGPHVQRCLRRLVPRSLRSAFDTVDFTQNMWVSIFRESERLTEVKTPRELLDLLLTIARNKVLSAGRRCFAQVRDVRREILVDTSDTNTGPHPTSRDPTPSAVAIFRERWERIVHRRQPLEKQVVLLRLAGSTFAEIAQRLKIDERTARKIIKRLQRRHQEEVQRQRLAALAKKAGCVMPETAHEPGCG